MQSRVQNNYSYILVTCFIDIAIMAFLIGKRRTPQQILDEDIKKLRHSKRKLKTKKKRLEKEKKAAEQEIQIWAKKGEEKKVRSIASKIVRIDNSINNIEKLEKGLDSIGTLVDSADSSKVIEDIMGDVTKALTSMNKGSEAGSAQMKVVKFEREIDLLKERQEIIEETLNEVNYDSDEETKQEEIVDKVILSTCGDLGSKFVKVPKKDVKKNKKRAPKIVESSHGETDSDTPLPAFNSGITDSDLFARFEALHK